MKARNEKLNGMANSISRFLKLFTEKKSQIRSEATKSENRYEMSRVTDDSGNEYLCPISKLKDQNFVSEREKVNCFDYNSISRSSFS